MTSIGDSVVTFIFIVDVWAIGVSVDALCAKACAVV